jgi:hypothetical protein
MRLLIEAALMVMWRSWGNRRFWSLVSARPKTYIYILYILVFSGSVTTLGLWESPLPQWKLWPSDIRSKVTAKIRRLRALNFS